jgi:hypothetical protein
MRTAHLVVELPEDPGLWTPSSWQTVGSAGGYTFSIACGDSKACAYSSEWSRQTSPRTSRDRCGRDGLVRQRVSAQRHATPGNALRFLRPLRAWALGRPLTPACRPVPALRSDPDRDCWHATVVDESMANRWPNCRFIALRWSAASEVLTLEALRRLRRRLAARRALRTAIAPDPTRRRALNRGAAHGGEDRAGWRRPPSGRPKAGDGPSVSADAALAAEPVPFVRDARAARSLGVPRATVVSPPIGGRCPRRAIAAAGSRGDATPHFFARGPARRFAAGAAEGPAPGCSSGRRRFVLTREMARGRGLRLCPTACPTTPESAMAKPN